MGKSSFKYAWVLDKTGSFPRPPKLARMPAPTASPDKAHAIFAEIYGMWGTGKFADPATKDEAMAAKWAPDIIMDTTSWCQSKNGIFKLRHGFAGGDEWVNTVLADWELSNLDMELKGCPAPPNPPGCQPGTVAAYFTYDVKHKTTGKELKGQCDIMEWYLSADGKCLGGKFYFGNPLGLSSIYPPAPAIPESVALFFDGTPITTEKIAKIEPTMSDSAILEFIGPYTGLTTGMKMPKPAIIGKVMPLFASAFPESFIFNADKVCAVCPRALPRLPLPAPRLRPRPHTATHHPRCAHTGDRAEDRRRRLRRQHRGQGHTHGRAVHPDAGQAAARRAQGRRLVARRHVPADGDGGRPRAPLRGARRRARRRRAAVAGLGRDLRLRRGRGRL